MSPEAADWWWRAIRSLRSAEILEKAGDHDRAASTAYYAAFYAVSALFTFEDADRSFRKHAAVRAAVHRELVQQGRWTREMGRMYTDLFDARVIGDYGGEQHVDADAAVRAIANARTLLDAVARAIPEPLPPLG